MENKKINVKARFVVTENHQLSHEIIIQNIPISRLEFDGKAYKFKLMRNGEKGSLSVEMSLQKELPPNKNKIDYGCCQITRHMETLDIKIEKVISHKAIKPRLTQYQLEYAIALPSLYFGISYFIPKTLFDEKYTPRINKMIENRKLPQPARSVSKKVSKKTTKEKPKKQVTQKEVMTKTSYSDKGKALRTASDTSFRRCEHCDYFIQRQKRCGLFSKQLAT